jgi:hypothetical protein
MGDPVAELWLVMHLAARCLETGSLRTFWQELERHAGRPHLLTRGVATLVWIGLLPIVPLLARRRHRLVARALEAVVRTIASGEQIPVAVDRGVRWLVRKGLPADQARADLERLLAGFLSGARSDAVVGRPHKTADGDRASSR